MLSNFNLSKQTTVSYLTLTQKKRNKKKLNCFHLLSVDMREIKLISTHDKKCLFSSILRLLIYLRANPITALGNYCLMLFLIHETSPDVVFYMNHN